MIANNNVDQGIAHGQVQLIHLWLLFELAVSEEFLERKTLAATCITCKHYNIILWFRL